MAMKTLVLVNMWNLTIIEESDIANWFLYFGSP